MDLKNRSSRFCFNVCDEKDAQSDSLIRNSDFKLIGYFSVNSKKEYCPDISQLKYIYYRVKNGEQSVRFDLNHSLASVIRKSDDHKTWDKLNNMFTWLKLNSSLILPVENYPFVTFRGVLANLLITPFQKEEDWTVCAKFYDGIIYLCNFDTEEKLRRIANESDFEKNCQLWGYKFEQFMVSDDPRRKPEVESILNTEEEMCCVFNRMLGDHRLIYGAEMDGIESDHVLDVEKDKGILSKTEFFELKTSRSITSHRGDITFRRRKLLKWWSQSYLVGVKYIICGFRDDHGIVKTLKRYKVSEIPQLGSDFWDPSVCLNFLHRFLSYVKRIILENDNGKNCVWKFDYNPRGNILVSRIEDSDSKYTSNFKEIKIGELGV